MRYSQAEKMEIIRTVEGSQLSVRKTLKELDLNRGTFYQWYRRYKEGGYLTTAGGVAANRIASWDGSSWSALGSGMDATVSALTVYNGDLFAGGGFTTAGNKVSSRIARWNKPSPNNPPVALCQDVTVSADTNCQAAALIDDGSFDPDADPITLVQEPAGPYSLGATSVDLIVTDDGGLADTCTATVTVEDNTPPVVSCPSDMTVDNDAGQCDAVVTYSPTATDNCPGVTVVADPASDSTFGLGTTQVEVIATDASGQADTCYFNVTVNDTEYPVVSCWADTTIYINPDQNDIEVFFSTTVSDNCPDANLVCDPPSGSIFSEGETIVICIGTDASGNADTCSFSVTVVKLGNEYLPGDANMALGIWPPTVIGGDVTYLVGYFIGGGQESCLLDGFWCSADINGDCVIIGGDVTAPVGYFVAGGALVPCPDYEPAWLESIPDVQPAGWPNCDTPIINSKVIPTGSVN